MSKHGSSQHIIVVGVGVSGLVSALYQVEPGSRVTVVGAGPDPRTRVLPGSASSWESGAPERGISGRFLTPFEAKCFFGSSDLYPDLDDVFGRTVFEGGWLAKPVADYRPEEREWLRARQRAASRRDLHQAQNAAFADELRAGIEGWQAIMATHPELFRGTSLSEDRILRLYDQPGHAELVAEQHRNQGALHRLLRAAEVAADHPLYREAVASGAVQGGVEGVGFAFNFHRFLANLMAWLEERGVTFRFETRVRRIVVDTIGHVTGLETEEGELLVAESYDLHPGAFAQRKLLEPYAPFGLGGVAGRWMLLPEPDGAGPLPTKYHVNPGPGHHVIDLNVTPVETRDGRFLALGSGYVFVGCPPYNLEDPGIQAALAHADRTMVQAVQALFGSTYDRLEADGRVVPCTTTCIRAFTVDDIPVAIRKPTTTGGVFTLFAGTNTGTATLAPAFQTLVSRP